LATNMKIFLESLGCARNLVDSEVMLGRLNAGGRHITQDPGQAEVIIVNTCSFIESAASESIDTILELAKQKDTGACRRLIVTGCLPERYRQQLAEALPEVDLFLGTGAYDRILDAVSDVKGCLLPDPDQIDLLGAAPRLRATGAMAYLKIAEGCSRHCTYCIIPKLRGVQKSRPRAAIVAEARELIASGARELVLVAQETTAYGSDQTPPDALPALLRQLAEISETTWIRFLYGHPESLDAPLLETVAAYPNICPYFDIPVQHASDAVLRRMGRNSRRADLFKLFAAIREKIPEAALRTTVIVGFPGETEADVDILADFMETVRFDHLGVFTYSDASDLPSHRLADPVSSRTARKRYDRIMELQKRISSQTNEKHLDRIYPVLIEEIEEPGLAVGRTVFQAPEVDGVTYVRSGDEFAIGDRVTVTITDTLEYDLIGEKS
jgi:ribosomal protein S12 methylthiotransferase